VLFSGRSETRAGIGTLSAPCAPIVSDFALAIPRWISCAASVLTFRVELEGYPLPADAASVSAITASLVLHTTICAQLCEPLDDGGVRVSDLAATFAPDAPSLGAVVTVLLPTRLRIGAEVRVCSMSFAGTPINSPLAVLPASASVVSMVTPLSLPTPYLCGFGATSAITTSGTLFVPQSQGLRGASLRIFEFDGKAARYAGMNARGAVSAVAACEVTNTLVVVYTSTRRIVGLDLTSLQLRWSVKGSEERLGFLGVAILSAHGVVVVSVLNPAELRCYAVSNGAFVSSLSMTRPIALAGGGPGLPDSVFVSTTAQNVMQVQWDSRTLSLTPPEPVAAANENRRGSYRLLTVMPPAPGKSVSHLIVGTWGTPELLVISLPDCTLVHVHEMEGIEILGLAADPSGTVLAVSATGTPETTTRVLAWPLEGMPPLL
jgi:hypothetical protein